MLTGRAYIGKLKSKFWFWSVLCQFPAKVGEGALPTCVVVEGAWVTWRGFLEGFNRHCRKSPAVLEGFGAKFGRKSAENRPAFFRADCLQVPSLVLTRGGGGGVVASSVRSAGLREGPALVHAGTAM